MCYVNDSMNYQAVCFMLDFLGVKMSQHILRCYFCGVVLLVIFYGGFLYTSTQLTHCHCYNSKIISAHNPVTRDTIKPTVKDVIPSTSNTVPPTHDDTHSTPSHVTATLKQKKYHQTPKSNASASTSPPTHDDIHSTPSHTTATPKQDKDQTPKSSASAGTSPPTKQPEDNPNDSALTSKTVDVKKLAKVVAGKISNITLPQLDEIVNTFGLINFTFSKQFKVEFVKCPAKLILQKCSKNGGGLHIPMHFQTCKNMTFKKDGDSVAFISPPGSGNSWIRQLLETTTGIYTGSRYCDPSYVHIAGMMGEGINTNNVLVVKNHDPPQNWNLPDKILFVVRNPFDAYVAEWNRYSLQKKSLEAHTGIVSHMEHSGK